MHHGYLVYWPCVLSIMKFEEIILSGNRSHSVRVPKDVSAFLLAAGDLLIPAFQSRADTGTHMRRSHCARRRTYIPRRALRSASWLDATLAPASPWQERCCRHADYRRAQWENISSWVGTRIPGGREKEEMLCNKHEAVTWKWECETASKAEHCLCNIETRDYDKTFFLII